MAFINNRVLRNTSKIKLKPDDKDQFYLTGPAAAPVFNLSTREFVDENVSFQPDSRDGQAHLQRRALTIMCCGITDPL